MTQQSLKEIFEYRNGELLWKQQLSNRVKLGHPAGSIQKNGYKAVTIKGKSYYIHRLIYIYHNGNIPENLYIDHIDRNRLNNSIKNLRCLTQQENNFNTSTKGYIEYRGKFITKITLNHKQYTIGTYSTPEEATKAYKSIKPELHVFLQEHPTEEEIRLKILKVKPLLFLNNKSGFTGVHQRPNGTFQARIRKDGKTISLGHFATAEEANKARINYLNKLKESNEIL